MADVVEQLGAALAGRYRLEREVGQGGMATVYLAQDLKHGRPVAIKVLRPELAASIGGQRFLREIEIAAGLQHPHILPLHDSGAAGGFLYYVMPYVAGASLRARLEREGELPLADAVRILREVTDAVGAAHARGVVHRDLKPENVLLSGRHALVVDFGIAKALSDAASDPRQTTTGLVLGTPAYMAPEQAAGEPSDHRVDIYALGALAYELLTGRPPFQRSTPQAQLAAQLTEMPPPLGEHRADVPQPLESLVMRCLARQPADRPQRAEEVLGVLDSLDTGPRPPGVGARALFGSRARPATTPRGSGGRWFLGALLLTAITSLVITGWLAVNRPRGERNGPEALPAIAVLPFSDATPQSLQRYLASSIAAALSLHLKAAGLRVVEPELAASYVAREIPYDSMARVLALDYVVSGEVLSGGSLARVTVRLVDPRTGDVVDTVRVERGSGDALALVDAVVTEVGYRLQRKLGHALTAERWRAGTRDPEAYALVARAYRLQEVAHEHEERNDTAAALFALAEADSLLVRALRRDRRYAEALIQRAAIAREEAILHYGLRHFARVDSVLHRGELLANQAHAVDRTSATGLEVRGGIRFLRTSLVRRADSAATQRLTSRARADLERAVELDPRLVRALKSLADVYVVTGEFRRALAALDQAYRMDTFQQGFDEQLASLFSYSFELGEDRAAEGYCAELNRRAAVPFFRAYCELQLAAWSTERGTPSIPAAWAAAALPAHTLEPSPMFRLLVAGVIARAGLPDSARAVVQRVHASGDADPELFQLEAGVRVLLHDYQAASRLLRRYAPHTNALMASSRRFAPLPENPLRRRAE